MNPYSEIFRYIFTLSESFGYDTYDFLPPDLNGDEYPFIFIGEQTNEDIRTKTKLRGKTNIVIHAFSFETKRQEVEEMINKINLALVNMSYTNNYYWILEENKQRFFHENQDKGQPLVHGVLEVSLEFLGKGE
ncbi:hypothetical protein MX630_04820 [Carnobacterium divergens]|uniref:hypothetical protein n=1 Tax=Carnobacterium divergens TaxID=2748 RepID=UPI002890D976|nr:hypothetical protein [Carnobacterium divergens]MDT1950064.1 hypothetical protein [Carnobacterium divergens]MDT1955242.1 hypothetical protein [Carnobacterium divergens]MDT1960480.1 hypothetical protein [Carnobacterium divergens]MDT1963024.1 hypothetical protein [Carnobacterium divergens]